MNIPNEAVEAAAEAIWDVDRIASDTMYEDVSAGTAEHLRREARAALEAAAPFLAAQALRDAADEAEMLSMAGAYFPEWEKRAGWLRDRLREIAKGDSK